MLPKKIGPNQKVKTETTKLCETGAVGDGAVIDCRRASLKTGDLGDHVITHSVGTPKVDGTVGDDVIHCIYDQKGNPQRIKPGKKGTQLSAHAASLFYDKGEKKKRTDAPNTGVIDEAKPCCAIL